MGFAFDGLDHIQLAAPAGCETEARKFFGGLLGWEEIPKPDKLKSRGGVWFRCGEHEVHIGVQSEFVPAVKAHPAFRVRNLAELRAHLIRHRVPVTDDDARADQGVERFYASDPFGNRIEFLEWKETGR